MAKKKIYFRFEQVTRNKVLDVDDNTLQVGFLNYSAPGVLLNINGGILFPIPLTADALSNVTNHLFMLPILEGEKDATRYDLKFQGGAGNRNVIVIYKMENPND